MDFSRNIFRKHNMQTGVLLIFFIKQRWHYNEIIVASLTVPSFPFNFTMQARNLWSLWVSTANELSTIATAITATVSDRFKVVNFLIVSYCTSWLWRFFDSWFSFGSFSVTNVCHCRSLRIYSVLANEERRLLGCFVHKLSALASFESERLFNKMGESLSPTFK